MSSSNSKGYSEDSYLPTVDWGAIGQSFDYKDVVNYLLEPAKKMRFKVADVKDIPLLITG